MARAASRVAKRVFAIPLSPDYRVRIIRRRRRTAAAPAGRVDGGGADRLGRRRALLGRLTANSGFWIRRRLCSLQQAPHAPQKLFGRERRLQVLGRRRVAAVRARGRIHRDEQHWCCWADAPDAEPRDRRRRPQGGAIQVDDQGAGFPRLHRAGQVGSSPAPRSPRLPGLDGAPVSGAARGRPARLAAPRRRVDPRSPASVPGGLFYAIWSVARALWHPTRYSVLGTQYSVLARSLSVAHALWHPRCAGAAGCCSRVAVGVGRPAAQSAARAFQARNRSIQARRAAGWSGGAGSWPSQRIVCFVVSSRAWHPTQRAKCAPAARGRPSGARSPDSR